MGETTLEKALGCFPRDREEELRGLDVAHCQFLFRFGASQTSESSKSDLENGDHDGSVDSEEEEERPPPSPHKGSTPEQKDSDSCQGTGAGSASLGLQGSQQHSHTASSPGQSPVPPGQGKRECQGSLCASGVSGSCSPCVRQPHRENPRERVPAMAGLGMRRALRSPCTQAIPWFCVP